MEKASANSQEEWEKLVLQRDRSRAQFACTLQWLELFEDGTNLLPYFKERHCSRIAVYGAGELGRMLLKETEHDDSINVSCFIDRNAEKQREKWDLPVRLPEEYADMADIDMVVVTAITSFESICDALLRIRPEIPVVSLKTILEVRSNEVWYERR